MFDDSEGLGDAESAYREAIRHSHGLGNALRALGRLDEAAEAYRRAIDLDPGQAQLHAALGGVLWDAGRANEAGDAYREAIRLAPGMRHIHRGIGISLRDRGLDLEAEGRYGEAVAMYHDAYLVAGDEESRDAFGGIVRDTEVDGIFENLSELADKLDSPGPSRRGRGGAARDDRPRRPSVVAFQPRGNPGENRATRRGSRRLPPGSRGGPG